MGRGPDFSRRLAGARSGDTRGCGSPADRARDGAARSLAWRQSRCWTGRRRSSAGEGRVKNRPLFVMARLPGHPKQHIAGIIQQEAFIDSIWFIESRPEISVVARGRSECAVRPPSNGRYIHFSRSQGASGFQPG